jgi:hypothetical protein
MTELCGSGWLVEGEKHYTPIGSWQFRPDIADIAHALELAYAASPEHREVLGQKAVEFAQAYDADLVFSEHLLPALETAERRFAERQAEPLKVAT